jgi:hypothetical protein
VAKKTRKILLIIPILFIAMQSAFAATLTVEARTRELYIAHIEANMIQAGTQWVSKNGILHIKGDYWLGNETTSGAFFEAWIDSVRLDQTTGEGTFRCKWLLYYPSSMSSIDGTARGEIRGNQIFGTFTSREGSNLLEGARRSGSFEGVLQSPTHVVIDVTGVTTYH